MKTTMNFFMSYMIVIALMVFTSCKKDNLQDAVIPQDTVAENTTNSAGGTDSTSSTDGTDGSDGTNGSDGSDGTDGSDGSDGTDGVDGTDGTDGEDGADGQDGADGADGATGPQGPAGADGADGADGATGPQGPAGADGANGADGATGPAGADGNANVISSGWKDANFSSDAKKFTSFDLNDSRIKQSIIDNGVVLAYGKWAPAIAPTFVTPTSIPFVYNNSSYYISFPQVGKIRFNATSVNGVPKKHNELFKVRYVIIPGNFVLGLGFKGITENDLGKMSYSEVCAALNISE